MFEIRQESVGPYNAVVTATNYENPFEDLAEVAAELRAKMGNGHMLVLFDLLCSNGDERNRFYKGTYENGKFDLQSFGMLSSRELDRNFLIDQIKFLIRKDAFSDSVLTPREQKRLLASTLN